MGGWVGGRKDVLVVEGFLDQDGVVLLLLRGHHTQTDRQGRWVGGWMGRSVGRVSRWVGGWVGGWEEGRTCC